MKKQITITVSGKINTGKTAIAELINELLSAHGFDVEYVHQLGDSVLSSNRTRERLESLKSLTKIRIDEVSTKCKYNHLLLQESNIDEPSQYILGV